AVAKDIRVEIEHDLVARPLRLIVNDARPRIGRQCRFRQLAPDFLPQIIAKLLNGLFVLFERPRIELRPEKLFAAGFGLAHQLLRVVDELVELLVLTDRRVKSLTQVGRWFAMWLEFRDA